MPQPSPAWTIGCGQTAARMDVCSKDPQCSADLGLRPTGCHVLAVLLLAAWFAPCVRAGLDVYYPFDGNANDDIGTADGTVSGASLTTGYTGQAYSFDGNDYIQVPVDINPATLAQVTMGGWFKPTSSTGRQPVLSHDNGNYDRTIAIDDRNENGGSSGPFEWRVFTGAPAPYVVGGVSVTAGEWNFVAAVYDKDALRVDLYVDGVSISKTGANVSPGTGFSYVHIGRNPGFSQYFTGDIDDVFFYDEALSASDIENIRQNGVYGAAVPELSSLAPMAMGLLPLLLARRRKCRCGDSRRPGTS